MIETGRKAGRQGGKQASRDRQRQAGRRAGGQAGRQAGRQAGGDVSAAVQVVVRKCGISSTQPIGSFYGLAVAIPKQYGLDSYGNIFPGCPEQILALEAQCMRTVLQIAREPFFQLLGLRSLSEQAWNTV